MTERVRETALVGGLTAVALALRWLGLAEGDFWADELATRNVVADRSPGDVLVEVQATEGAPHLYYLFAWAWSGVFGAGEAGLRSLSALAGALVTPIAYLTLRQVGLRTEALIAGALAAVSPLLIWYSQEARVYSLFALLTAVSLLFFVRVLVDFSPRALVAWSLASAATLLTHYFALFTIVGMAAVLVHKHRARWQLLTLSLMPTALAGFAIWPAFAAQGASEKTGWIDQLPLGERLLQLPEHFLTGLAYPPLALVLVAGLLAAAGAAALLIHDQRGRLVGVSLVGVAAVAIGLPLLAIAVGSDFVISRYLLAAIIPLLLAISVGLGVPRLRPAGPIVAVTLVCLLAAISVAAEYDDDVERAPWDEAAADIAAGGAPDMVIACCGIPASPARYYVEPYDDYDAATMGDLEVDEVVLATIERPDHRPDNDYCWWGAPCQASDELNPEEPASPGALSEAFASTFDHVETWARGSITLARYRASRPVALGPQTPIRLAENEVIVGDDIRSNVTMRVAP